ncbi:type II secretion system protein M [Gammaproteobacteria bacterium]|nr:type II secretion system protein M [Gammaproteobacteria bacterium]
MIKIRKYLSLDYIENSVFGIWYQSHNQRDRKTVKYLTIAAILMFLGLLVIKPVFDWNQNQKKSAANAYQILSTINANHKGLKKPLSKDTQASNNQDSLIPIITKTASLNEIQLNKLQPQNDDSVAVYLENQSFNRIIKWISQIKTNNEVKVSRINVESSALANSVNVQVVLIK